VKYKLLGRSGIRVSELCLGTSTFGEEWGWGASREESARIFERFAESGGNFVDTSGNHTDGTSERYIGDFVHADRDRFVIATKYGMTIRSDHPNGGGNTRKSMMQALKESMKRMRTDYIDLYWMHIWDFTTPIDEIMRAMDDLVRGGTVLSIGISDTPAWIIAQANSLSEARGWTRPSCIQVRYNLIDRTVEQEYIPMARAFDLALAAWSPLGGGLLTGKYNVTGEPPADARLSRPEWEGRITERALRVAAGVKTLAASCGHTPSQVALSWLRQRPGLNIPILGARSDSQLRENLGCLEFELDTNQLDELDALTRTDPVFPYDMLTSERAKRLVNGELWAQVENHRLGQAGHPW
jgi:aryl-alcohol dehydrogenase-like predicted oxidoreductase